MRIFDAAIPRLLRYDLSRDDVIKWVLFTRQMLAVVLVSVVLTAGLSAALSIRQTQSVLEASLKAQARATAQSVAKAAFVPLTLEDDAAIAALVDSYRRTDHLGRLIVRDAAGRIRHELTLGAGASRELRIQEPIVPARGTSVKPPTPIGFVEVGMRRDWIDREIDRAAWTNISITGILSLAILALGGLVISRLVARTRELVGEAELVEEVKRANAELETFSYSVAHDLRAPARAIISFSQMLTEDYADKLDEEGRDYLRRVHAGGRRMEELIDDLLSLSRVTRSTIARQWFDLSEVARQVCSQLKDSQPERAVEFVVQDGLSAEADPNLARTLLENLLGNAWKYTMKHARARVEFGRAEREGETIYFVRDDGAGFNMDYAGKLFKPFSRLHQASEFAGAGIGLATVHRIIERHGGRIWAESAVEKGSTFYFTLGERT